MIRSRFFLSAFVFLLGQNAQGQIINGPSFDDLSALTNSQAVELLKVVGLGADHRAYATAAPLGVKLGLDIGLDVTAITLPSDFESVLTLINGGTPQNVPDPIPLPRIQVRKGFPSGIDAGFAWFGLDSENRTFAFDLQWSFLRVEDELNMALRGSFTDTKITFLTSTTFTVDLVSSYRLNTFFEPYGGVGYQMASGTLDVPAGALPVSTSASQSFHSAKAHVGLRLNISIVRISAEYTHSFEGVSTYGAKTSISI